MHTMEKLALCGEIIFLFLLCDLARWEGVLNKEPKWKIEIFLWITCNQEILMFSSRNGRIWNTEILSGHAEEFDQKYGKSRWTDASKPGSKLEKIKLYEIAIH